MELVEVKGEMHTQPHREKGGRELACIVEIEGFPPLVVTRLLSDCDNSDLQGH